MGGRADVSARVTHISVEHFPEWPRSDSATSGARVTVTLRPPDACGIVAPRGSSLHALVANVI